MRYSVALNIKKCRGCTTCIKSCPTEAIRVRSGKATILPNRCIDCGTCVQVCPHKAVQSQHSDFYMLRHFQYNIAVPDPALYAQFQRLDNLDIVLNGLLSIGFDDVFESAAAAELLADCLDHRTGDGTLVPELSPACPAVVRLICIRFPDLLGHIAPVITPLELAAILARRRTAGGGRRLCRQGHLPGPAGAHAPAGPGAAQAHVGGGGRRGEPRPRPRSPFPAVKGLFGKPTLLNNVETYANITWILNNGWEKFAAIGAEKSKGTKRLYDLLCKITDGNGTLEELDTIEELCYHLKDSALCARNCPTGAITGAVKAPHFINTEKCIKCGLCQSNCRFDAIVKH